MDCGHAGSAFTDPLSWQRQNHRANEETQRSERLEAAKTVQEHPEKSHLDRTFHQRGANILVRHKNSHDPHPKTAIAAMPAPCATSANTIPSVSCTQFCFLRNSAATPTFRWLASSPASKKEAGSLSTTGSKPALNATAAGGGSQRRSHLIGAQDQRGSWVYGAQETSCNVDRFVGFTG